jgi:phage-related protein
MPIVVEAVSMKEFVYNKYIEALLNIVDEDPDLELIQDASASSSLEIINNSTNVSTSFDLSKLEDKNYLIELSSQNSRKI